MYFFLDALVGQVQVDFARPANNVLSVYRYGRLILNIWASRSLRPMVPGKDSKLTSDDVTVVIASLVECENQLKATLQSIYKSKPREVIIVTVEKDRQRLESIVKGINMSGVYHGQVREIR